MASFKPSISANSISKWVQRLFIPGFPGILYNSFTKPLCLIFHARACSLPPDPIINIFFFTFFTSLFCNDRNGILVVSQSTIVIHSKTNLNDTL